MTDQAPPQGEGVSRRRFIIGSSALAAAPVVATWATSAPAHATEERLSIGYVVGSAEGDGATILLREPPSRVVPLALASGPRIYERALVTLHGIYPWGTDERLAGTRAEFDVVLHERKTGGTLPIYLWTRSTGAAPSTSHPATLTLPVRSAFDLVVRVGSGESRLVRRARVGGTFTPLREGVYLLPLGAWSWRWSSALSRLLSGPRTALVLSATSAE